MQMVIGNSKLSNYGVNTLILSPIEQPSLVAAVKESDDWMMIYQDDIAFIFIRDLSSQQSY